MNPDRPTVRALAICLSLLAVFRSRIHRLIANAQTIAQHPLFKLTVIGLSIRLLLAPVTQFTYDPVVWYSTGNDMLAGMSPYFTRTYSYPPLWAYTYFPFLLVASFFVDPRNFAVHLSQMDWISLFVGYSPTILSPVFLLTIKLPLIIGDLATGFLLFKIVKDFSGFGKARKAYVFWFFNPFVIWTNSVHGAFDVLPAMFTLLAMLLLLRSNYLQSGMSMSVAILFKLYPVYLLPLYAILVWTDLGRDRLLRTQFFMGLRRLLIFVGGGLIPLLLSLLFVSIPDMLHAVSARQAYLSSMGGLSPWMLNYAPGFGWMWDFASNNLQTFQLGTGLVAASVAALAGWRVIRRAPVDILGLVKTHILAVSVIYLTLITVNPQYVLWILPFLTAATFIGGVYVRRGILLVGLALGWQLTISGTLVFLPVTFLGLPPRLLISPVQSILVAYGPSFNPILLLCGLAGGVVLLSLVVSERSLLLTSSLLMSQTSSFPKIVFRDLQKSIPKISTYLLPVLVVSLSLSAVLVNTAPVGRVFPTSINSTVIGNTLTIRDSFVISTGTLPLQVSFVAAPIVTLERDRPVFIYYDASFPALGNGPRGWIGILDHLMAELRLRGYNGQIQIVSAVQLGQVMTQDFSSIIVIPSGVFPSTVQNATSGFVGNWLRSGGTLVWMGGPFGFYSSTTMQQTLDPSAANMSIASGPQENILGYHLTTSPINGTSRMATTSTEFSLALNLAYSDVWVAPTLGLLRSTGGLAIGHLQNTSDTSRSSISIIPVGQGRLLLFGGPVSNLLTADGEDVIAHDAAQVLSLGNLALTSGLWYRGVSLAAGVSTSLTFVASFSIPSSGINGVALTAFSSYGFSRLYWRTEVALNS